MDPRAPLPGDWIWIEGLTVECVIGVTAEERHARRKLVVDVGVQVDAGKVAVSDSIEDTVDYREIARAVLAEGEASSFQLIETLAAHLARIVLERFPRVLAARVEVEKPGALRAARAVRASVLATRGPA